MGYGDPNVTNHNNTTNVANQTDAEALITFANCLTEPVLLQLEDPHQETPSVPWLKASSAVRLALPPTAAGSTAGVLMLPSAR